MHDNSNSVRVGWFRIAVFNSNSTNYRVLSIDCQHANIFDTITFNDFDAFFKLERLGLVDMVMGPESTYALFERSSKSTDRYGKVLLMDLKPYGIHLVKTDEGRFLPLQTVSDVVCNYSECPLYFSGDAVVASEGLNDEGRASPMIFCRLVGRYYR